MTTNLTAIDGPVWSRQDSDYDRERRGFQLLDPHRPAHIVGATSARDIQEAVRYAAANHLKVAVKARGHGHTSPLDGGVLITTSRLSGVRIDPDRRTAWIEAGASWQQVIEAAAPHGLAPLSGSFPGVGAISYTLGGGLALMARQYGFAADHVRRAEVVTADGELRRAEEDPDLFWAIRGGGGNFGVVTGLEVDLFPHPTLYGGSLYFDLNRTPDVVDRWREWTQTLPEVVTSAIGVLVFPDIPMVPESLRGKYVAQLQVTVADPTRQDLVEPLRAFGEPLLDTLGELPFTESGRIFAEPERPGPYRSQNLLINEVDPNQVSAAMKLAGPEAPAMCVFSLRHLGGALARKPAIENAVGHRDAAYAVTVLTPGEDDVRELHRAVLEPWSAKAIGRQLNFSFTPLTAEEVRAAYEPADYLRLTKLKTRYDAQSLLQANHPIAAA